MPRCELTRVALRAAEGDEDAFDELVRRVYQRIYRWALIVAEDPDEAEDVTQEVLVRLHRKLPDYAGGARFTTWLYRITLNVGLDRQRVRARRHEHLRSIASSASGATEQREDPLERLWTRRLAGRVRELFTTLSDSQRRIFDLVDLQGFTPTEAAEMLELNPLTVRSHLFRARRAMRRRLVAEDPDLGDD